MNFLLGGSWSLSLALPIIAVGACSWCLNSYFAYFVLDFPFRAGEFDNAGAMMSVDETLMCSFQGTELQIFFVFNC